MSDKSKDVAWKYSATVVEGNSVRLRCNFCGKVTTGGVFRMKEHLMGGRRNAKGCTKVSEEVRQEVIAFMESKKKSKDTMNLDDFEPEFSDDDGETGCPTQPRGHHPSAQPSAGSSTKMKVKGPMDLYMTPDPELVVKKRKGVQPRIDENDTARKELRKRACKAFARWMYDAGIPFNAVNYPSFPVYVEAQGQYGAGMKPPSYHEVRVPLLKDEVEETRTLMKLHEEWVRSGCSIMYDGWEDRKKRTLINFLVNTPRGSFFLESVDASAVAKTADLLFELISKFVERIGPQYVVQVVTDSASNNKAAGRMLTIRYPHLFWTPCAAHCIDLILEDIFTIPRFKNCINNAMALNSFIYSKCGMVNMLREFTSHKELVRPAKTRFATAFLTLSRICKQKANLFRMFTSQRWITSPYYKEPNGKKIASIVMMPSFWNSVVRSCKVAGPLVGVLRLVDGENRPPMGYIYEAMDRAKEAIAAAFNKNEARYQEYYDIIDNRWDIQLHQPLHAAGYYLNPEFYYKNPEIEKDKEVSVGLYKCIERMIADVSVQDKIGEQLEIYKRAEGLFGLPMAIRQRTTKSPGTH